MNGTIIFKVAVLPFSMWLGSNAASQPVELKRELLPARAIALQSHEFQFLYFPAAVEGNLAPTFVRDGDDLIDLTGEQVSVVEGAPTGVIIMGEDYNPISGPNKLMELKRLLLQTVELGTLDCCATIDAPTEDYELWFVLSCSVGDDGEIWRRGCFTLPTSLQDGTRISSNVDWPSGPTDWEKLADLGRWEPPTQSE